MELKSKDVKEFIIKHSEFFMGIGITLLASFVIFMTNEIGKFFILGMILGEIFSNVALFQILDYQYVTFNNGLVVINGILTISMLASLIMIGTSIYKRKRINLIIYILSFFLLLVTTIKNMYGGLITEILIVIATIIIVSVVAIALYLFGIKKITNAKYKKRNFLLFIYTWIYLSFELYFYTNNINLNHNMYILGIFFVLFFSPLLISFIVESRKKWKLNEPRLFLMIMIVIFYGVFIFINNFDDFIHKPKLFYIIRLIMSMFYLVFLINPEKKWLKFTKSNLGKKDQKVGVYFKKNTFLNLQTIIVVFFIFQMIIFIPQTFSVSYYLGSMIHAEYVSNLSDEMLVYEDKELLDEELDVLYGYDVNIKLMDIIGEDGDLYNVLIVAEKEENNGHTTQYECVKKIEKIKIITVSK